MNTISNTTRGQWQDSMADWSVTHQRISEAELDRFIAARDTMPIPLLDDECADWATRKQPQCVGTCETPAGCSFCGEDCLTPQACQQPERDVDLSHLFPLEPYFRRHKWLGPLMAALISFVWLCIDGYLENLPK